MRIVIQRVNYAKVIIDGKLYSQIDKGYLLLLGIGKGDTKEMADKYISKLEKLRIFADNNGKTNLSIQDVQGELMVVSQFTLYADCKKGNRPSFVNAGLPEEAQSLYEYFVKQCEGRFKNTEHGVFGADMKIQLENDGPFTIIWDSSEW